MDDKQPSQDARLASDSPNADESLSPGSLAATALHRPAAALAVSLVIVPVLYRIGFVGSIVIVVLAV